MIAKLKQTFRRASRERLSLSARLIRGEKVLETETINISDTGVLLKKPKKNADIFMIGEYMQLHIDGYIKSHSPKTSVFPVVFVRKENNTIALEFI